MSNLYSDILSQIARTRPVTMETVIRGEAGLIADGLQRRLVSGVTPVVDPKGRRFARVTAEYDGDLLTVCEPVMPRERLIVLGGGHIALPVCEFGAKCGFEVHVVDDRPDFANRHRFPDAAEVICSRMQPRSSATALKTASAVWGSRPSTTSSSSPAVTAMTRTASACCSPVKNRPISA